MIRLAAGALLTAALLSAPAAVADPDILTPDCTGGQIPQTGACTPVADDSPAATAPGVDPQVPLGLNPESAPAL